MRLTQKDIAKALGISFVTVNRAFNESSYVSEPLKKQILDYAKKRGYVPHRASQVLVRNKQRTIAVFSSSEPSFFWDDIAKGVASAAEQIRHFDYVVRYHRIPDFDTERYLAALSEEIKNGLNAAAFVNQRIFDMQAVSALVEKARIPYIMYNVDAPETRRLCYVGSDYRAGGRLAANFIGKALTVKGSGTALAIGFIQKNAPHTANAPSPDLNSERLEGFLAVMKKQYPAFPCNVEYIKAALTETSADASSKNHQSAGSQIEKILRENERRVEAVYFIPVFNEAFHRGLLKFDYSRAITVQHDVDASTRACLEENRLTAAVFQDPFLQGFTAVRELERILESKTREKSPVIDITPALILKENVKLLDNRHFFLQ